MTYRVTYTRHDGEVKRDVEAHNPITALNAFHREMQKKLGYAPDGYKITGLAIVHPVNDRSDYPVVESVFDLAPTRNPDLLALAASPVTSVTEAMGFLEEVKGGKLAE
jgi:hypothetical protein